MKQKHLQKELHIFVKILKKHLKKQYIINNNTYCVYLNIKTLFNRTRAIQSAHGSEMLVQIHAQL